MKILPMGAEFKFSKSQKSNFMKIRPAGAELKLSKFKNKIS